MEPRMIELQKSRRLEVEMLEERLAPSHVDLPLTKAVDIGDMVSAVEKNPHFSGRFVERGVGTTPFAVDVGDVD